MQNKTANTSEINDTMWRMHRRTVTGTMILSILLLYALAITAYSNLSHAKMFSFGWSNRIIEDPGRDAVASLYRENRNTSSAKLDSMLKQAMSSAMCRPVLFSGGIQWGEDQVTFWLREGKFVHAHSHSFRRCLPHATAYATPTSSTSRQ